MRGTLSLAVLGLAIMTGSAHAQLLGVPGLLAPPVAGQGNPIQDGAYVVLGPTRAGNLGVAADVGRQLPIPLQATVSPDGTKPVNGLVAYARLPKDGNGLPNGVDVRLTLPGQNAKPIAIQLGKQ